MGLVNNWPICNITLIKPSLIDLILIRNYSLTKISNYITLILILTHFCIQPIGSHHIGSDPKISRLASRAYANIFLSCLFIRCTWLVYSSLSTLSHVVFTIYSIFLCFLHYILCMCCFCFLSSFFYLNGGVLVELSWHPLGVMGRVFLVWRLLRWLMCLLIV